MTSGLGKKRQESLIFDFIKHEAFQAKPHPRGTGTTFRAGQQQSCKGSPHRWVAKTEVDRKSLGLLLS